MTPALAWLLLVAQGAAYPDTIGQPADIRDFVVRHADCEHWLGEEPYDADRRAEIEAAVRQTCTGIDTQRRRLLHRYRHRPTILHLLRRYPRIEG